MSVSVSVSLCFCLRVVWCVWCCGVWCVVLCCVVLCVVWCGVVWCVARLGTQRKPPCVDSKRPRVYRHHAHMCYHMRAWCRYTRGRFESTHGGFLDGHTGEREERKEREREVTVSSAYREKPTKSSHSAPQVHRKKPLVLTHSRFENRSRTTRSRFTTPTSRQLCPTTQRRIVALMVGDTCNCFWTAQRRRRRNLFDVSRQSHQQSRNEPGTMRHSVQR